MEGKSPRLALKLFGGAEWRASKWLEDGANAKALDDAELAQKCFERRINVTKDRIFSCR